MRWEGAFSDAVGRPEWVIDVAGYPEAGEAVSREPGQSLEVSGRAGADPLHS